MRPPARARHQRLPRHGQPGVDARPPAQRQVRPGGAQGPRPLQTLDDVQKVREIHELSIIEVLNIAYHFNAL